MTHSKWIRVGSVRRFDDVSDVLDITWCLTTSTAYAMDAIGSYLYGDRSKPEFDDAYRKIALGCCADVIQATLNLVAALGVEDFRPYLKACEKRNRERGRITDGKAVDE